MMGVLLGGIGIDGCTVGKEMNLMRTMTVMMVDVA
jgi:hypothetical protein